MCKTRAVKTRKAKDVAGNESKVILCNKCFGNFMQCCCLNIVTGPKVAGTIFTAFFILV